MQTRGGGANIACNLFYGAGITKEEKTARFTQDGEDRECEPGQYLKAVSHDCVIGYKYFEGKGVSEVGITVRGNARGSLTVSTGEQEQAVGMCNLELDCQEWQEVTIPVDIIEGKFALFFHFEGEGSFDMLEFALRQ